MLLIGLTKKEKSLVSSVLKPQLFSEILQMTLQHVYIKTSWTESTARRFQSPILQLITSLFPLLFLSKIYLATLQIIVCVEAVLTIL